MTSSSTNSNWTRIARTAGVLMVMVLADPLAAFAKVTSEFEQKLTSEERNWVQANPVIKVGLDDHWRPICFRDATGAYAGIDPELLAKISEHTGLKFETGGESTWAETLAAVISEKYHVAASSAPTEERHATLLFGKPYMTSPVVYVARNDAPFMMGLESLENLRVALPISYFYTELLERQLPKSSIIRSANAEAAIEAVAQGRADVTPAVMIGAGHYITERNLRNVKIAGVAPYNFSGSFITTRDRPVVISLMDKAVDSVPLAERRQILERWMSPQLAIPNQQASRRMAIAMGMALAVGTAVVLALRKRSERQARTHVSQVSATLSKIEKQLGLSEFILDKSANAVYLIDESGTISYVNARAVAMSGYSAEELLSMRNYEDLNPDYSPEVWDERWKAMCAMPEGKFLVFRTRQKHKNGTVFPIEVTAHLITHEGRPYNLSLVLDITERVRTEKEHAHLVSLSERALELTRSGYWSYPLDGSEHFTCSERTATILGLPAAPGLRYPITLWTSGISAVDPEMSAGAFESFTRACEGDTPNYEYTFPFKRPIDDRVIWLHSLGVRVNDPDRPYPEMHGVLQDVTDIVETRRNLESARKAAEQANRLKTEFLANMSHEIRTPMNAILGYAQLMRCDPSLPKDQLARVEPINRAGEHLLALIDDILAMSKIEAGRVTLSESPFDLHKLLEDLVEVYSARARAKGLLLTLERAPDLPRGIVTDEAKLRQTLLNLVGNAIKFTAKGGILLSARAVQVQGDSCILRFAVADTGPGISNEEITKLFRPFVQTSTGVATGGTGLGLAISRQYANLLGGDITVVSQPGSGSTFTLTIQARSARDADVLPPVNKTQVKRLADGQGPVRILVVDDVALNRQVVASILAPFGFETRTASDGKEAVALFNQWKPQAVLMDMRMPGMDGYEATRQIRTSPGGRDAYVLALTASAFEEERSAVLASGADDLMRKPFKLQELLSILGARLHLTYLFEEEPSVDGAKPTESPLSALDFSKIPQQISEDLVKACSEADYEKLVDLCTALGGSQPDIAARLRREVDAFNYDSISRQLTPQP